MALTARQNTHTTKQLPKNLKNQTRDPKIYPNYKAASIFLFDSIDIIRDIQYTQASAINIEKTPTTGLNKASKTLKKATSSLAAHTYPNTYYLPHDIQTTVFSFSHCIFESFKQKDYEILHLLINNRKVDINTINKQSRTMLTMACIELDFKMINWLINHGADPYASQKVSLKLGDNLEIIMQVVLGSIDKISKKTEDQLNKYKDIINNMIEIMKKKPSQYISFVKNINSNTALRQTKDEHNVFFKLFGIIFSENI